MKRREVLWLPVALVACGPKPVAAPTQASASAAPEPARKAPPLAPTEAAEAGATAPSTLGRALRLGAGVWSPFTDAPGKPRLATDLVLAALKRASVAATSKVTGAQDFMPQLEAGKFDGSEVMWHTQERAQFLLFSKPYLENRLVLLTRNDKSPLASELSELKGKRLGLVKGYAYGPEIWQAKGPVIVDGSSDEDNLRRLLKGEIDYTLVDELLVYYLFNYDSAKATRLLRAGAKPIVTRPLHFVLRKDVPGAAEIMLRFDEMIPQMIADGSYHRILHLEWLVADVDGDGRNEAVLLGSQAGVAPPTTEYRVFGPKMQGTPRFMVNGEVYDDWSRVPDRYKVERERIDSFRPGVNIVLFEF